MVLQKRYGFNGYQIPPTPRAPRSARKRVSSWKKKEDNNQMNAFDLLATVAGKLLLEDNNDNSAHETLNQEEETRIVNESVIKKENDSLSCNNKSFFVSEIISKAPVLETCSGPASGITVADCSQKVLDFPFENVSCKIEDINNNNKETINEAPENGKPLIVHNNIDSNVNLVIRDDDENENENKRFRAPTRIGDRRIRRLLASKQWKVAPKLNDDVDSKPVYRNKKSCYKHQRSLTLRDYPFKKRKLYHQIDNSNSNERSDSCRIKDGSSLDPEVQDSHVKLKIKSFRVPEVFIEIPETATVSSLKRRVMDAVNAIFSGEVHVGVMLQGKRIRDDNKTLLQTGICHDNKLDALGFTLEPEELRVPTFLCNEEQSLSLVTPPHTPKPVANQLVIQQENVTESDRDSVDPTTGSDSRALVTVPNMNAGPLTAVPMRKSKRAEVAQRRIRRPFSVSEVEALVEAVEKLGTGRWRDVKLRAFDDAKHRTYVDLKDKWKTLVHTARISPQQRRGEPVPQELLDRVLAAHGYWSHHQAKNQFKHQPQTEICRLL